MDSRLDLIGSPVFMKFVKYVNSAGAAIHDSLPATTQELVKIRASQINGCAYCTDMHTKDAALAGETSLRLNLIACGERRPCSTRQSERRSSSRSKGRESPMPLAG